MPEQVGEPAETAGAVWLLAGHGGGSVGVSAHGAGSRRRGHRVDSVAEAAQGGHRHDRQFRGRNILWLGERG